MVGLLKIWRSKRAFVYLQDKMGENPIKIKVMKILYLHGLESIGGGKKAEFLSQYNEVKAPIIDYKNHEDILQIEQILQDYTPELIVGSSMGGYYALILGSIYNIPTLTLNPAIHSRVFEPHFPKFGKNTPHNIICLGMEDKIIDPDKTLELLPKFHLNNLIIPLHNVGHRFPLSEFERIYNKLY